ncbi:MAG TPA: tetratricopeptide repeat protein [Thermoanaerobaculia bacterium]|jgi:tetratricopeptide (TPR) repeat protein|nr:tetratricopeptide repeat protein [Thermoanaerobaculia bacterium]
MRGRTLAVLLTLLLAVALAGQSVRWRDRLTASRLLGEAEALSLSAVRSGRVPAGMVAANLQTLHRAALLDPVEVGIPNALGNQYLFLSRFDLAIQSFAQAQALEPRPEGYFNLGKALWSTGRTEEAQRDFDLAVRIDPWLAGKVALVTR